jgi:hypothetical protein
MTASPEQTPLAGAGAQGRVPDFFIVGQPKSGTTALYEMLRTHPQVFMPDFKEPRYYAGDLPSRYNERAAGLEPETYADYLSLFEPARSDQLAGEASTAYIWSKAAAANIAAANPDAKIIAILREPASYLRSMHLQLLQIRVEKERSLRRAIALEEERRRGRKLPAPAANWPAVLLYTDRVRYVEQLRRYEERFAPEQLLVLIYDDFRSDNEATVRKALRFLEIDEDVEIARREANPTVRMRSVRLDETVRAVTRGEGTFGRSARGVLRAVTPRELRLSAHRAVRRRLVFGAPGPPDQQLMLELRRRFKDEVQALSEHMGRDLTALWGYDRID